MNIKKITALLGLTALLNINCISSYATADGGFSASEINSSEIKPSLSLTQTEIKISEAEKNPLVTVELSLEGADYKYSTLEIWTSFDSRLQINSEAFIGEAVKYMSSQKKESKYIDFSKSETIDLNGIRIISASTSNSGRNGKIFSVQVKLPENVQAGDVFPLNIVYLDRETSNNNFVNSTFINSAKDRNGELMQAWTFTNGLKNGFIKITADNVKIPGDVNLDGRVTLSDAVSILQYISNSEKYPLSQQSLLNADVNKNGDGVSALDALSIQKFDSGIIESLPESYLQN